MRLPAAQSRPCSPPARGNSGTDIALRIPYGNKDAALKDAPWLAEFEAELLGFPGARHDDQVDSLSQYFGWVRERPKVTFECHWMRDTWTMS